MPRSENRIDREGGAKVATDIWDHVRPAGPKLGARRVVPAQRRPMTEGMDAKDVTCWGRTPFEKS
jgi:hypothetical protein